MKPLILASTFIVSASLVLAGTGVVVAAPKDIGLPAETGRLKESPLAGYAIASQKCGICHSADYVDYQPPKMTKAQWTSEMTKMQHAYGAPISDDEVRLLGIYLASAYGDAGTVTAEDKALGLATTAGTAPMGQTSPEKSPDVRALLTSNGCLACHATDRQIVGPGYHDVATRYKADPQAVAHVTAAIRQGGAGRWGTVPMPPFASIGADDAKALATYVLAQ